MSKRIVNDRIYRYILYILFFYFSSPASRKQTQRPLHYSIPSTENTYGNFFADPRRSLRYTITFNFILKARTAALLITARELFIEQLRAAQARQRGIKKS